MSQKTIKMVRRSIRRHSDKLLKQYVSNLKKYPFWARVKFAWEIIIGKEK